MKDGRVARLTARFVLSFFTLLLPEPTSTSTCALQQIEGHGRCRAVTRPSQQDGCNPNIQVAALITSSFVWSSPCLAVIYDPLRLVWVLVTVTNVQCLRMPGESVSMKEAQMKPNSQHTTSDTRERTSWRQVSQQLVKSKTFVYL
ncbi:hypothetical protein INR49_007387 [Caranx melampygus]|nr:hypothetical protein INR49_007387 [Caranx melampygus]